MRKRSFISKRVVSRQVGRDDREVNLAGMTSFSVWIFVVFFASALVGDVIVAEYNATSGDVSPILATTPFGIPVLETSLLEEGEADEALNDYFLDVLEGLREVMPTGLKLLDLPILDPFTIESKVWSFRNENTRFVANFSNVLIRGLSTFEIEQLDVSIQRLRVTLRLSLPELTATGWYHLRGIAVYVLPLRGEGEFSSRMCNLTVTAQVQLEWSEQRQLKLRMLSVVGEVAESALRLDNFLSRGNMGNVVQSIVQRNSRRIIGEAITRLRANLEELIGQYTDIIDSDLILELKGQTYTNITSNHVV